jgi:ATP-dependent RNA helicase DOB1
VNPREKGAAPKPCVSGTGEFVVVPVLLSLVESLSSIRLFIKQDLRSKDSRKTTGNMLREAERRFPDGVPRLDPIEDMKIKDETFLKLVRVGNSQFTSSVCLCHKYSCA